MYGFRPVEYYENPEEPVEEPAGDEEEEYTPFAAFENFESNCEEWLPMVLLLLLIRHLGFYGRCLV